MRGAHKIKNLHGSERAQALVEASASPYNWDTRRTWQDKKIVNNTKDMLLQVKTKPPTTYVE